MWLRVVLHATPTRSSPVGCIVYVCADSVQVCVRALRLCLNAMVPIKVPVGSDSSSGPNVEVGRFPQIPLRQNDSKL